METLFGIPVDFLMWMFLTLLALIIAWSIFVVVRQPILFRLSARNIQRRIGRAFLIVIGLMLATTIISAAFGTGDTIAKTIRTEVITGLGNIDEIVSAQEEGDIEVTGEASQLAYFDEAVFEEVRDAVAGNEDIDGVMPVIWEGTGIQNLATRQTEPRVTVFGADPAQMDGFGTINDVDGGTVTMDDLASGELYVNPEARDDLDVEPGNELEVYGPAGPQTFRVKAVVRYDGGGTTSTEPGVMMRLSDAQALFQREGQIEHIVISNRGGAESGAELTDDVIEEVRPVVESLGLSIEPTKQEDLKEADDAGDEFSTFFVTFGSFSIAAGILLIFLIFVMLAGERKTEMGITRAVGGERRHLVEMFALEGLAYDLVAAAIGAALGIGVAWVMIEAISSAFENLGVELRRTTTARSLITAYAMGVVITFFVVTLSAWRVSILNIVAAIRNLPEAQKLAGRGSLVWVAIFLAVGLLLTYAGLDGEDATAFYVGTSLIIIAAAPLLRWLHASDRVAFTAPSIVLLIWWLLPADTLDFLLPEMSSDFNIFIASGLIMVGAATAILMYNSDVLLRPVVVTVGRVRALAPVVKTAISYPLTNRFRTGVMLAMFTLVVFTLVVGAVTTNAFTQASDSIETYGGGFDLRAETVRVNPIDDLSAEIAASEELDEEQFEVIADQSLVAIEARQTDTDNEFAAYAMRGLSDEFFENTTYGFYSFAEGYDSPEDVWAALRDNPNLAVIDGLPVPRRAQFNVGGTETDFQLEGFFIEDETFDAVDVEVRDPVTGQATTVTVIAVLTDIIPPSMIGISTSQRLVDDVFPDQSAPTAHLIRLEDGADPESVADSLESEFLENGMEAVVLQEELDDFLAVQRTFNYIVEGFLGLGLIVGVAALGTISARSVVERRHEIGVMRAIGFERERVQISFLLESCMAAIVGIIVGTLLGIAIAFNIIRDTKSQPGWETLDYTVPWLGLGLIYLVVLIAVVVTVYIPARRASRVYPAAALRYE